MKSGPLERAIKRYKYDYMVGWRLVFGRVVAGFLKEESHLFRSFDLIIPSPVFVGAGGRPWSPTAKVLERVDVYTHGEWPIDLDAPPVLAKKNDTTSMARKGLAERGRIAREEIVPSLEVRRGSVDGRVVLVYDDVFTTGWTLNAVSQVLRDHGAMSVHGLSLARQPPSSN